MALDVFVKIGSLESESEDKEFNKWIDVLSWSWGGTQSGTARAGGGMGGGKVDLQDFTFTKRTDMVSPKLWLHLCTGKHFDKVEFKVRKAGGEPFVYLEGEFTDCIITGISTGGAGGDDLTMENVSLNFKKFKLKYHKQSAQTGKSDGDDEITYDLAKNEAT